MLVFPIANLEAETLFENNEIALLLLLDILSWKIDYVGTTDKILKGVIGFLFPRKNGFISTNLLLFKIFFVLVSTFFSKLSLYPTFFTLIVSLLTLVKTLTFVSIYFSWHY